MCSLYSSSSQSCSFTELDTPNHHLPYDVWRTAHSIAAHDKTYDRVNEVARLGDTMLMSLAQTAKYDGLGGARSTSICPSGRADGVGGIQMPWLNQAWQLSTAQPVETWHSQMGGQPVETWQSNGRSDRTLRTAESVDGMRDVERLHARRVGSFEDGR